MIELSHISKSFVLQGGESLQVLKDVSFQIRDGEAVGLSGTSGSGKTTLLNITAGLLTPDNGSVTISGTSLYSLHEAKRDRFRAGNIGYIFQNFNLLPSLTAMENVMAAMSFAKTVSRRERTSRCLKLLEQVGLKERQNHRPDELSGGEQQRVCIARALANHPPVLLADEPTANLDRENRRLVTELLLTLCEKEGTALIVSTHDPELLAVLPRTISMESSVRREESSYAV